LAEIKIVQSELTQSSKEGVMNGEGGLDIGDWFEIAKASIKAEGHLKRTATTKVQKDGEYYQVFWRLADAGFNYWRAYGIGLNKEGILEQKIIGDKPLCYIASDQKNADTIMVDVKFQCDLRDLWLEREDKSIVFSDSRFDESQAEKNRIAVAKRICAIALNRAALPLNAASGNAQVMLARQKLQATRNAQIARR
jgi:hypothetical protein